MNTQPHWATNVSFPRFPALDRDMQADVVVIGGGIMGVTTAHLLQEAGASVVLMDRMEMGGVDTGHTTAHLTHVTDTRFSELVKNFGRDQAEAVWDAGRAAIHRIHEISMRHEIDCEFKWVPGFLHAPLDGDTGSDVRDLEKDAALAGHAGFSAAFVPKVPLMNRPGVRFSNQAKFHPRKYIAGLLRHIAEKPCHIFANTEVTEIREKPREVRANDYSVRCGSIVLATHVPRQGITGTLAAALLQTKLAAYTTYAASARIPRGTAPEASFWDTGEPYWYLRVDSGVEHDIAILGGADHKTGQATDTTLHFDAVEKNLRQLIPEAEIEHRWSGQVIETNDGLPFIGETAPGQFVGTGFAGNGMTFGTVAAMLACDALAGRQNSWLELFDVHRKKLLGGTWQYLRENKDYPYYYVKDRMTKPASDSYHSVPCGEGRIVKKNGKLIAAYRSDDGKLTCNSAICPHMGCIVHWNEAEKTWDCPCHGSRFLAHGKVLTGPAESDLKPAREA